MTTKAYLHTVDEAIPEQSSVSLSGTLLDFLGAVIGSAAMTAITLTLYDKATGGIINGKNGTNILNANSGGLDVAGNWTLILNPTETVLLDTLKPSEVHVALITWTYLAGGVTGRMEIEHTVNSLTKV